LDVVVNHFRFENIAQFCQGFQVINMNYQRSKKVVQVST